MTQHGGNITELAGEAGLSEEEILDFSANINPLGPPEWLRPAISRTVERVAHYPDPDSTRLIHAVAAHHEIAPAEVVPGNGTSQVIFALCRAAARPRTVIPVPAYVDYAAAGRQAGSHVTEIPLREEDGFRVDLERLENHLQDDEIVFLGQPNNPTGLALDPARICDFADRHPGTLFAVDEAFVDFADDLDSIILDRPENVVVLRSMTKFYAVPGLRLGYAVAEPDLAERIRELLPPWSLNVFAQEVGRRALEDEDYARRTREMVDRERERLRTELGRMPALTVYPGRANFLLVRIDRSDRTAPDLAEDLLLTNGIAIRVCENFGGLDERFFRLAVRTQEENHHLIAALSRALGHRVPGLRPRPTPAIMFQGTSSSAGKSVMTAALCRILLQEGLRVAPFKAQNMSLNSFVTPDGRELGRAQAMQAQACRVETDVRMNPVLLKPNSDTGCQVIVNGRPVGNMAVGEYVRYKPEAFRKVQEAYDSLAAEYDAVVLEGAGSPAEINLKHHDIVNMRMA
jgi:L-threonine-O-3-phosphate decarboxylase